MNGGLLYNAAILAVTILIFCKDKWKSYTSFIKVITIILAESYPLLDVSRLKITVMIQPYLEKYSLKKL